MASLAIWLAPMQAFAQEDKAGAQGFPVASLQVASSATSNPNANLTVTASNVLECNPNAFVHDADKDFFGVAAVCLDAREMERASVAYHLAMIRGVAAIQALGIEDKAPARREFSTKRVLLEAPIYNWALADIPSLVIQIQSAINWDQENPVPAQLQSSGQGETQYELVRQQQRVMLSKAILDLLQNKDRIYLARHEAGAAIRDPAWTEQKRERVAKAVAKAPVSQGLNDAHDHDHDHSHVQTHAPVKAKSPSRKSPSHLKMSKP